MAASPLPSLLAWLCLTLAGGDAARPQPGAAALPPAPSDEATPGAFALDVAARVRTQAAALAAIWPGFWPPSQAFVVNVPGSGALLVADSAPAAEWRAIPAERLPAVLRGRAYFRGGPIEGASAPFITNFPIGGGKTAIFVNAGKDAARTAGTLLHEQFHVYQNKAFRAFGFIQFVSPSAVPDRVAFVADAEVERRILAAALTAGGGRRTRLLRAYFAVRREREARLPGEVRAVERGLERVEGTARYVDGVARARLFPGASFERLVTEDLHRDLIGDPAAFTQTWFRMRSYGTGAALTRMLSQADPSGWRTAIEAGGDPAALLERRIGTGATDGASAAAARRRFGHDALLRQVRTPIEEAARREIKSREDFLKLGAHAVTVQFAAVTDESSFTGDMVMLSRTALALPRPKVFTTRGGGARLTVRDRPVMTDIVDGGDRVVILLDEPPAVTGRERAAPGVHRLPRLDVEGGGLELHVDGPVEVRADGASTFIRLMPRP